MAQYWLRLLHTLPGAYTVYTSCCPPGEYGDYMQSIKNPSLQTENTCPTLPSLQPLSFSSCIKHHSTWGNFSQLSTPTFNSLHVAEKFSKVSNCFLFFSQIKFLIAGRHRDSCTSVPFFYDFYIKAKKWELTNVCQMWPTCIMNERLIPCCTFPIEYN